MANDLLLTALEVLGEATDRARGRRDVPLDLPLAWLELGAPDRALEVARRQTRAGQRLRQRLRLARDLLRAGLHEQATELLRELEGPARRLERLDRTRQLGGVCELLALADEPAWAERVWRSQSPRGKDLHGSRLRDLVGAWLRAGELDRAEALVAEEIGTEWYGDCQLLVLLARGRPDELEALFDATEKGRHRLVEPVLSALVDAGLYDAAERLVRGLPDAVQEASALALLTQELLAAGQTGRARGLVDLAVALLGRLTGPADAPAATGGNDAYGRNAVVQTLVALGETGLAVAAAALALARAQDVEPSLRGPRLTDLLLALGPDVDDLLHAQIAADAEAAAWGQVAPGQGELQQRLQGVAAGLAAAGEAEPAYGMALLAHRAAHATSGFHNEAVDLGRLVDVLAAHGRRRAALGLARTLPHPRYQAEALASLIPVFEAAGEHDAALALAADTQEVITRLREPQTVASVTRQLALALLAAGEPELARALALAAPVRRGWGTESADACTTTARTFVALGLTEQARAAAEQAWRLSPRR